VCVCVRCTDACVRACVCGGTHKVKRDQPVESALKLHPRNGVPLSVCVPAVDNQSTYNP
jgi:hypothetical protein